MEAGELLRALRTKSRVVVTPFGYVVALAIAAAPLVIVYGLALLFARYVIEPRAGSGGMVPYFGWLSCVAWLLPMVGAANAAVVLELTKDGGPRRARALGWIGLILSIGHQVYRGYAYLPG